MRRSTARVAWMVWALGLALVLVGLGLQVRYAQDALDCARNDLLVLCSGPLAGWLMPTTVLVGLALVALGAWRLLSIPH